MQRLLPPLCLLLALAMAVAGFGLWSVEAPQPSAEMHRAIASGNQQYREAWESQLRRQQFRRKLLLGCLFLGSGGLIVTAFVAMQTAESRRDQS